MILVAVRFGRRWSSRPRGRGLPSRRGHGIHQRPLIVHVAESWGGGVQSAIRSYVETATWADHVVVARTREGSSTFDDGERATLRLLTGSLPVFLLRTLREIRRRQPCVVHLHSSFAGALRALPMGVDSVVYSPHCFAFERLDIAPSVRALIRRIEARLLRRNGLVFAGVSTREIDQARELSSNGIRTELLPNRSLLRPASDLVSGEDLVAVGRLSPQKDPLFFLEVVGLLKDLPLRAVWVGDGDEHLRNQLETNGVEVTGWLSRSGVEDRLANGRALVHTAAWESTPIALLDAAQLGLPVVCRSTEGLQETAFYLAGGTARDVASAVRQVWTDPQIEQRLRTRSRELRQIYSADAQASVLRRLYRCGGQESCCGQFL